MTNSEPWEAKAVQAGRKSGDLLAPIVYCPELHFSEFASAVADMKNSAAVSIKPEGTKETVYKKKGTKKDKPGLLVFFSESYTFYTHRLSIKRENSIVCVVCVHLLCLGALFQGIVYYRKL